MNEKRIRNNFKLFKNKKLIYFDNSASTLKPKSVIKAELEYNQDYPVNSGRGVYRLAYKVTRLVEDTREKIAKFINAKQNEIIFTKNTTDSLNLVAWSYAKENLKPGDEIILSKLEHHSNLLPWLELAKITDAKIVYVPLTKQNKITVNNFKKVVSKKTKIVALTFVSNVLGYITPLKAITKIAHENKAIVVIDAAQAISHFAIDVKDLNCDFLAFSGYKMLGPNGVGILYGKETLLKKMKPIAFGGGMVLDISDDKIEYKEIPYRFEAGTLPISSIIGLSKAVDFINKIGYDYIVKKDAELNEYLTSKLKEIEQIEIYSNSNDVAIVSFNIKNIHAHDVATMYDEFNICVRAGHHCAQPLIDLLKVPATVRASLYFYNTKKEIDRFIYATNEIINFFDRFNKK